MESLLITQPSSEYWAYPENYSSSSSSSTNRGAARSGFEPEVWMKPEPLFRVEDLLDFSQHDEADEEKEKEEEEEILINSSNSFNNNETNIKNLITEDETCCYNKGLGLLPADELEWLGNFMEDDNSSYYRFFKEEQQGFETLISTEITEEDEEEEESITIVHPCESSRVHMQGRSKARSKRCRSSRPVVCRQLSGNPLVVTEESQNSSPLSSSSSAEEETEQVLLTAASCRFTADSPCFLVVPTPAASLFPSLSSLSSKKNKKKKKKNGGANENSSSRNADRHPRKKTKGVAVASDDGRRCSHCQVTKTPQWRAGPLGPKTLCNACGVRFKSGRLLPEYRPAGSPSFESHLHSNSHRKVLEMRSGKNPRQPALLPQVAEDDRQEEEQEESCLNDSTGSTTTTLCSDDCLIV